MTPEKKINRRKFIGSATAASIAFTIVPRHVLGGPSFIPPSDKLTIAYIGCGTQGLREMAELITNPKVQIVTVCDPNKSSTDYIDWSAEGIRNSIRKTLGDDTWGKGFDGIPGGRDVAQDFVDKYYSKDKAAKFKGCTSYVDFRELLEKEKDIFQAARKASFITKTLLLDMGTKFKVLIQQKGIPKDKKRILKCFSY